MQASKDFKHAILTNMLVGLKERGVASRSMSVLERKRSIMASANVAMALARGGANWTRAIIARQAKQGSALRHVRPSKSYGVIRKSTKISKRYKKVNGGRKGVRHGSSTGSTMVKWKLQVLKRLVPGGEMLDDRYVVKEALDYVVSLRAQVDVMQSLVESAEILKDCENRVDVARDEEQRFCVELRVP